MKKTRNYAFRNTCSLLPNTNSANDRNLALPVPSLDKGGGQC